MTNHATTFGLSRQQKQQQQPAPGSSKAAINERSSAPALQSVGQGHLGWKQRYELLLELVGPATALLDDIERDGLTEDHRMFLGCFNTLLKCELVTA